VESYVDTDMEFDVKTYGGESGEKMISKIVVCVCYCRPGPMKYISSHVYKNDELCCRHPTKINRTTV
jgi:hypothetical protein